MKTPYAAALLGALLVTATALHGQQPAPLTLDEAMTAALAASPALAAARLSREEARARGDVAGQRPNPELSFEESPQDFPRDTAALSVPIETGGKRRRRIEVAQAQARTGEAELARLMAETRNQVRRAYFGLTAAQRRDGRGGRAATPSRARPRRRPGAFRGR